MAAPGLVRLRPRLQVKPRLLFRAAGIQRDPGMPTNEAAKPHRIHPIIKKPLNQVHRLLQPGRLS